LQLAAQQEIGFMTLACIFAFLFTSFVLAQDQTLLLSQNTQSGDATYYGGSIDAGNCALNPVPNFAQAAFNAGTLTPAALNIAQYQGGDMSKGCGMCLILNETGMECDRILFFFSSICVYLYSSHSLGSGSGGTPVIGPKLVWIKDKCPECPVADIDLSTVGDGRWVRRREYFVSVLGF
jgi:hypothetical protein